MKLQIFAGAIIRTGYRLSGFIFDDARGEFKDGEFVTTSPVETLEEKEAGKKVITTATGSTYEIEFLTPDDWYKKLESAESNQ